MIGGIPQDWPRVFTVLGTGNAVMLSLWYFQAALDLDGSGMSLTGLFEVIDTDLPAGAGIYVALVALFIAYLLGELCLALTPFIMSARRPLGEEIADRRRFAWGHPDRIWREELRRAELKCELIAGCCIALPLLIAAWFSFTLADSALGFVATLVLSIGTGIGLWKLVALPFRPFDEARRLVEQDSATKEATP